MEKTGKGSRAQRAARAAHAVDPFSDIEPWHPLLVTAVIFGGVVRLTEILISTISTVPGLILLWQGDGNQTLSLSVLVRLCCLLFVAIACVEVLILPRRIASWGSLAFCLMLAVYGFGLDFKIDRLSRWPGSAKGAEGAGSQY